MQQRNRVDHLSNLFNWFRPTKVHVKIQLSHVHNLFRSANVHVKLQSYSLAACSRKNKSKLFPVRFRLSNSLLHPFRWQKKILHVLSTVRSLNKGLEGTNLFLLVIWLQKTWVSNRQRAIDCITMLICICQRLVLLQNFPHENKLYLHENTASKRSHTLKLFWC